MLMMPPASLTASLACEHFLDDRARDPDHPTNANDRNVLPLNRLVDRPGVGPEDFSKLFDVEDHPTIPLGRKKLLAVAGGLRVGCGSAGDASHGVSRGLV